MCCPCSLVVICKIYCVMFSHNNNAVEGKHIMD